jgi:hypothetical protein
MREGHRFRFLLAMNCQVAAVAADGTEVPYSRASGTMRQRAESQYLWKNLGATIGRKLGTAHGRSASPGNTNRRIVRIASPWLTAPVSVPGLPRKTACCLEFSFKIKIRQKI